VAIAGIMGGLMSEVTEKTKNVLLESAYFDPIIIRRGSKSLGLSSESSRRFERGADSEMAPLANNRACKLIADFCDGKVLKGIVDCNPRPFTPVKIELRPSRVEHLLGARVTSDEISKIFSGLDFKYKSNHSFEVIQPSFRPDLTREVDLIEEIARIHGFDSIQPSFGPGGSLVTPESKLQRVRERVRGYLVGAGLMEVFPLTLGDSRLAARLGMMESAVRLMNPISEEMAVARPNLILTMLPVIRRNLNFRESNLALFEIGDVYGKTGSGELPMQRTGLAMAFCGMEFPDFWGAKWRRRDIFSLKGLLEDLSGHLQLGRLKLKPAEFFVFEKGYALDVYIDERRVGWMGRLSQDCLKAADIKEEIYLAELDFETMVEMTPNSIIAKELAKFPSADRDIAVVVDESISAGQIEDQIVESGQNMVDEVWVFDLYKGKNIPEGKKSLAFGIKFRLPDRTLTDEEVNDALGGIVASLQKKFKAELRK
jgi:phenylalanyl-tRNA synthetase beta chain